MGLLPGKVKTPETLIGRDDDLHQLQAMLRHGRRLITLRGPGGIGKTCLAAHLATSERARYDQVVFVDLSVQLDPQQLLPDISAHLPVEIPHADPRRNLVEFARNCRALLILDNFEQLLPAASQLAEVLRETEHLQIVVTSRAALQLHDEHEYPVEPLALPTAPHSASACPAVQLFVGRARSVTPRFELTSENVTDVARLCEVLEGVPLAIELAASRLRTYALPDLLARLEHPLKVLKADFRDRPDRLRSLRAALEWSYDLLSSDDREVFECCAVFSGSFTPDALAAVWGGEDVLDRVESLIEQSFLHRVDGLVTRWKMLQPLRELALEHLEGHSRVAGWRQRHSEYFLGVLQEMRAGQTGPHPQARGRYLPDYPNMREGLVWATEHGMTEVALRYVDAMRMLWLQFGTYSDGRQLARRALALETPCTKSLRLPALIALAECLMRLGEVPEMKACMQEHWALCQEQGSDLDRAWSQVRQASVASSSGQAAESARVNQRVIEWYEQLDPHRSRERQHVEVYALALLNLSVSLLALGQFEAALEQALKGVERFEQAGTIQATASRVVIGKALLHLGRTSEAAREMVVALRHSLHHGFRYYVNDAAQGMMHVAADRDALLAVRFAAFASSVSHRAGKGYVQQWHDRTLARLRTALSESDFQAAWREGERLTAEEALRLAEALTEELSGQRTEATPEAPVPELPGAARDLTPRELEVLALVVQGHPDRKIAKLLNVSPRTASRHVGNMLGKLELRNRVELARWAIQHGVTA